MASQELRMKQTYLDISFSSTRSHLVSTLMCGSSIWTIADNEQSTPDMNLVGSTINNESIYANAIHTSVKSRIQFKQALVRTNTPTK